MRLLACFAFAAVAFADVRTGYDFNVRVMPKGKIGCAVYVNVDAPDGTLTGISEAEALPPEQRMTFERNGRLYTIVLRMEGDDKGSAEFEVTEHGARLAHQVKPFGRPLLEKPLAKDFEPPKVLERVEPQYPPEARAARVGGMVVLETRIHEDGTVGEVRVVRPLGYGLDEAAIAAVKQWKFQPAREHGQPVSVAFTITFNFNP
jgi:TonB family protein